MSSESTSVEQPTFAEMAVGDWKQYLRQHPDRLLCINGPEGVHTIQYDDDEDCVTFYAHGTMGYDTAGTMAVLQDVAEVDDSSGLQVQTVSETYRREGGS